MPQLAYNENMAEAYAGLKVDSRFDHVETGQAEGAIPFGYPVGAEAGQTVKVSTFAKDNATLLFDADFVTSNTIDGDVNGVSWAQVTFTTDHDTTAGLVAAAITALTGITCILDPGDANNRTFLIETDDSSIVTVDNVVVAAGASQAGSTVTYSSDNVFRGLALHEHVEPVAGVAQYVNTKPVSVLRQGAAWGETSVAVTADEAAYVDIAAATGKFTNVSTDSLATGGFFRSTVGAAGIAKVEINLP